MASTSLLSRLSPYATLGQIYRVRHRNKYGVSITRLLRRDWILNTPQDKRQDIIRFIVGECSLIENVSEALQAGYTVEIVTGPKIKDADTRAKMAELLRRFTKDRLRVYAAIVRPSNHLCVINGNILYEDPHLAADDYDNATAIENADKYNLNLLEKYMDDLKLNSIFEDTPEKIMEMPTLM